MADPAPIQAVPTSYILGVDIGGTFTDLLLVREADGAIFTAKVPSTPADPSVAVLSGIDSPVGAVVGGLMLGVGLNLLGAYVDVVGSDLRLPAALLVILVVLLVRPAGLFGKRQVKKV